MQAGPQAAFIDTLSLHTSPVFQLYIAIIHNQDTMLISRRSPPPTGFYIIITGAHCILQLSPLPLCHHRAFALFAVVSFSHQFARCRRYRSHTLTSHTTTGIIAINLSSTVNCASTAGLLPQYGCHRYRHNIIASRHRTIALHCAQAAARAHFAQASSRTITTLTNNHCIIYRRH